VGPETCYFVLRQVQQNCCLADFKEVSLHLPLYQIKILKKDIKHVPKFDRLYNIFNNRSKNVGELCP